MLVLICISNSWATVGGGLQHWITYRDHSWQLKTGWSINPSPLMSTITSCIVWILDLSPQPVLYVFVCTFHDELGTVHHITSAQLLCLYHHHSPFPLHSLNDDHSYGVVVSPHSAFCPVFTFHTGSSSTLSWTTHYPGAHTHPLPTHYPSLPTHYPPIIHPYPPIIHPLPTIIHPYPPIIHPYPPIIHPYPPISTHENGIYLPSTIASLKFDP